MTQGSGSLQLFMEMPGGRTDMGVFERISAVDANPQMFENSQSLKLKLDAKSGGGNELQGHAGR